MNTEYTTSYNELLSSLIKEADMRSVRILTLSRFLFLIFVLLLATRAYAPDEEFDYVIPTYGPIEHASVCNAYIGPNQFCTGNYQSDDDWWAWSTDCWQNSDGSWVCMAVTDCPAASTTPQVFCEGDYQAMADEAGVQCKDTGSDYWEHSYCQY